MFNLLVQTVDRYSALLGGLHYCDTWTAGPVSRDLLALG